jgi:cobalt/nickel transport system permease protein
VSRRPSVRAFVATGFLVAVLLALLIAPHASSSPDGLMKVAADKGLDSAVSGQPTKGALAGLSTGVAGLIGVIVVFCVAFGVSKIARVSRSRSRPESAA